MGRPPRRAPTARTASRSGSRRSAAPRGSTAGPRTRTSSSPMRCTTFRAGIGARGRALRGDWDELFAGYRSHYPDLADHLDRMQLRTLPDGWDADIPVFPADSKGLAGREANGTVLNAVGARVPWLVGGAADLAPSTKTLMTFEGAGDFSVTNRAGRNLHFGVREHAAGCIANGLALSKVRPYQAGFLIFSDFQRGAIRLSALMEIPVVHLFHPRLDRGRGGRPDSPARGTDRLPSRDPWPGRHPAVGRQRGRRGLARAHADAARPCGIVPVPPGPTHPGPDTLRTRVRAGARGLRPG